jgi:hypothetical protein
MSSARITVLDLSAPSECSFKSCVIFGFEVCAYSNADYSAYDSKNSVIFNIDYFALRHGFDLYLGLKMLYPVASTSRLDIRSAQV